MQKYLTISDELQLIPNVGGGFLSKSGKTLEEVEYEVSEWLEEHPTHRMEPMVSAWMRLTEEFRREQKQAVSVEPAIEQLEKSIRKLLFFKYRRKGLSIQNARAEAGRNAGAVKAKLMMED
jgi:hypothetical protein